MNAPAVPVAGASKRLVFVLILVSAINPVAVNMFVPAMPDIMHALATDVASVQMVLSAYLFATAVAQLVIGPLSDRFGRRPLMIGGLLVFTLASVLCALAPTVGWLIGGRILQGAGGCAGMVLSRAIVRDLYERDRAAAMLGYVTMGFAIAPMLSPTLGGVLNDQLGWHSIFLAQAIIGGVGVLATIVIVPETRRLLVQKDGKRPGYLASIRTLARIPAFWSYTLCLGCGVAVFFSFLSGTPVIAAEILGITGTEFGLYFTFVPFGFLLGNFLTARFSLRLGIARMMIAGTGLAVAAVLALGTAFALGLYHPLSLFVPMYFIGFANGLSFTNAIAGTVSLRPELAGSASGLAGSLQTVGGAVASVAIGVLLNINHSVFVLFGGMLVFAVASFCSAVWARGARFG
jgi:DHA1 family bicyclomycin/chloramphenicol resistance-like MFS transporter